MGASFAAGAGLAHAAGTRSTEASENAEPLMPLYPPYQQPLLDPQTRRITEPWHLFFQRVATPSAGTHTSLSLYDFSTSTTAPPTLNQVRIDAAAPYTTATKLFVRFTTNDGLDIYWRLVHLAAGTTLVLQDKSDHTIAATFLMTAAAVDQTTYMELPVAWQTGSGTFVNNQAVALVEVG